MSRWRQTQGHLVPRCLGPHDPHKSCKGHVPLHLEICGCQRRKRKSEACRSIPSLARQQEARCGVRCVPVSRLQEKVSHLAEATRFTIAMSEWKGDCGWLVSQERADVQGRKLVQRVDWDLLAVRTTWSHVHFIQMFAGGRVLRGYLTDLELDIKTVGGSRSRAHLYISNISIQLCSPIAVSGRSLTRHRQIARFVCNKLAAESRLGSQLPR